MTAPERAETGPAEPPARRAWHTPELIVLPAEATANGSGAGSDGNFGDDVASAGS